MDKTVCFLNVKIKNVFSLWLPNSTALSRLLSKSQWQHTHVWRTSLSPSDHWALRRHWQWAYLQTVSVNVRTRATATTHTAIERGESAVVFAGTLYYRLHVDFTQKYNMCWFYSMHPSLVFGGLEHLILSWKSELFTTPSVRVPQPMGRTVGLFMNNSSRQKT